MCLGLNSGLSTIKSRRHYSHWQLPRFVTFRFVLPLSADRSYLQVLLNLCGIPLVSYASPWHRVISFFLVPSLLAFFILFLLLFFLPFVYFFSFIVHPFVCSSVVSLYYHISSSLLAFDHLLNYLLLLVFFYLYILPSPPPFFILIMFLSFIRQFHNWTVNTTNKSLKIIYVSFISLPFILFFFIFSF